MTDPLGAPPDARRGARRDSTTSSSSEERRRKRQVNLRRSLFLLPNMITLSSVFCGFYSMVISSRGESEDDYYRAALLIIFAMFFDTLDGRVARMTKTESAFGLQFDSLADVLCFGAAPSLLVYHWSLHQLGLGGMIAAFVFTACGAIRLARFNVLATDQSGKPAKPSKYMVGLPIPGAAGILVSLVVANHAVEGRIGARPYAGILVALMLLLSALMVSTVRFRSFKDVRLDWRTLLLAAFLVGSSVFVSAQFKPAFVLVWLLGAYVALALFEWMWGLPRRLRERGRTPEETTSDATAPLVGVAMPVARISKPPIPPNPASKADE